LSQGLTSLGEYCFTDTSLTVQTVLDMHNIGYTRDELIFMGIATALVNEAIGNLIKSYQQDSPWPFYRGINYDGLSSKTGPLTDVVKWNLPLSNKIWNTSPVIDENGNIYICFHISSSSGGLYSINSNGSLNWTYSVNESTIYAVPSIGSDGIIYFTSGKGMYAINPDGSLKWKNTIGISNSACVIINNDGTLYTGTADTGFFAINPDDGSTKWNIPKIQMNSESSNGSGISVNKNIIYCGSNNGLFAIKSDGNILWYNNLVKRCLFSTPAFDKNGNIYIGSPQGIRHINYENGNIINTFLIGDCSDTSPSIDKSGNIYIGTETNFYVYDSNGTLKWSKPGFFYYTSSIIDANNNLYIYENYPNYSIYCINNGNTIWSKVLGDFYTTPAIGNNGTLYSCYTSADYKIVGLCAIGN
jgi:hypothetical protein